MKKIFFFAAALVAAATINAAETVELKDVANYIDFQALSVSDAKMTTTTITSTTTYTLANGSVLAGFAKSDGTEAGNSWNIKESYNTTLPTPEWEGVDSINVGTMFRAGSGSTITLGSFTTTANGNIVVYIQPNGDSERGISCSIEGGDPVELKKSGAKIDGVRPGYALEFPINAGSYAAGKVVLKVIANTSNIFGVRIDNLEGENTAIDNVNAAVKAIKTIDANGQLIIVKNGVKYNALGAVIE